MIDISILCLLLLQKEDELNFCFYTYRHSLIICIFMYETQTYVTWIYWEMLRTKTRKLFAFLYNLEFCSEYVPNVAIFVYCINCVLI